MRHILITSASPMEHVEANMSDALFDPFGMQQANPVPLETNDLFATNTDSTPVNNQSIIDIVSDIDQNCTSDQTHPPSVDAESNQNDELFGMMAQAGESVVSTAIELSQTDESEVTMIETNHQVVTKENDDRSTPEPIEPATMSRWREVQRERLQQKDAQESAANGLLREKAESELQDWYDTYQRTLEKRKQDNR